MAAKEFRIYVKGLLRAALSSRDEVQRLIAVRTLAAMALAQEYSHGR